MNFYKNIHKETRYILLVFALIAFLIVASRSNSLYQINIMNTSIKNIFENSIQISNPILEVRGEIFKIHRNMKDVVLSESQSELEKYINDVDLHEKHVYRYLSIIEKNINDQDGKRLELQIRRLFQEWKPIRDEVIDLVKKQKRSDAIAITKTKGANQVLRLEKATLLLDQYAQNRSNKYKNDIEILHQNFYNENIFIAFSLLLLLLFLTYYTVTRISSYIAKTAHLNDVLSVIREINQLIVREKNKETLVEQICKILITNRIYGNAWIVLHNDANTVEYTASADYSENFTRFKNKLDGGWMPTCLKKDKYDSNNHIIIENTSKSCPECPFSNLYESKGAFSAQLKYNGKIYGNLTLSVNTEYLKEDEELTLLNELASDISYALYNLETEEELKKHENSLYAMKELYENTINSVDNLIFVKNTDFVYIVCNQAFEDFVGKSKNEIIGKTDYEIFDKEVADFFREHDAKMFVDKKSKSNFEWVTYPNGKEVYLLTVKSPLYNSTYNLIGLVGNSVDITEVKKAEDALLESEERFKLTIQQSPAVIELYDPEGTQVEVNHAYEELWGFPAEHTLQKFNLFKSEEVKRTGLINYIQKAYAGEIVTIPPYEYDATGQTEANGLGRKRWLKTRIYPLTDTSGKIKNIVITHEDITEEIKSKNELRKSRENYQLLADNALDLIWKMNMDLEFTYVNPSVNTLLGYSTKEFIGTKLYQHCSSNQFEIIQKLITEMLNSNSDDGASLEALMYRKDGSEIPLEINGKIIFNELHQAIGFQGSARDFTVKTKARKELQNALNELEKKSQELQTVLEEAPNPIMLHNEAGEVLMVNKVWEKLSGYSFDEIDTIDKWTQKACSKKSLIKQKESYELYSISEKINLGENIVTSKDGQEMIWQVSSAPLGTINGKRTVVTSAMDITELKKKDEMMMAQSRHAAMGEMIGMIAHQWRQPIAGIAMDANNMLLDIAFETFDNASAAEYAQDILDQTNHLSKTIDDFRNFFKPDKSVSSVKVEDIMEETLAIVRESLTNNSITLKTSYISDSLVDAYPRELMQVFVNIINNAKDSLLSSHTQDALIEIKVYDDGDYVHTEICDNGAGIDEAVLPKIFDPYFSTKDEKTGTGLGLYMSKMIIEEHLHGYITASNNKDSGACFKVMLLKKL